jgi:AbrB family looped-hinge helix DNA binding protein
MHWLWHSNLTIGIINSVKNEYGFSFLEGSVCAIFLRMLDRSNKGTTMSDTAKLSSKFQISIPKAVRSARKWKAGQEFAFIPKGTGVLLVPVPAPNDLAGIAKGATAANYRDRNDRF